MMATVLARPRPQPLASFTGWRIGTSGTAQVLAIDAATLPDAIAAAVPFCAHKDTFAIREHNPALGTTTVRFYAVKQQSRPRYVTVDHVTRAVRDLYADQLFALAVEAFEPTQPWAWSPGADVVGITAGLVEGRA